MSRLLVAVVAWAVLTALAWLWVYAATRRDDDVPYREPDDGVQPFDPYTVNQTNATISYGSPNWRN